MCSWRPTPIPFQRREWPTRYVLVDKASLSNRMVNVLGIANVKTLPISNGIYILEIKGELPSVFLNHKVYTLEQIEPCITIAIKG